MLGGVLGSYPSSADSAVVLEESRWDAVTYALRNHCLST